MAVIKNTHKMKNVVRDNNGNIEMVRVYGNVYAKKENAEVFQTHELTQEEVDAYFGDDNAQALRETLQRIANMDYSESELRMDILRYNDLIK